MTTYPPDKPSYFFYLMALVKTKCVFKVLLINPMKFQKKLVQIFSPPLSPFLFNTEAKAGLEEAF